MASTYPDRLSIDEIESTVDSIIARYGGRASRAVARAERARIGPLIDSPD